MRFLTDQQREKALELLKTAPDEIILSVMVDLRKHQHLVEGTRANFNLVVEELNAAATVANQPNPHTADPLPQAVAAAPIKRKNTSPGVSTIGKIGANTKAQLLGMLEDGHQPLERWSEHMKLLWSRGEVKYDGTNFYT